MQDPTGYDNHPYDSHHSGEILLRRRATQMPIRKKAAADHSAFTEREREGRLGEARGYTQRWYVLLATIVERVSNRSSQ